MLSCLANGNNKNLNKYYLLSERRGDHLPKILYLAVIRGFEGFSYSGSLFALFKDFNLINNK